MPVVANCVTNCLTSTILSILLCRNKCSIDRVASKLAYFPPNPPSYKIETKDGKHVFVLQNRDLSYWPEALRASSAAQVFLLTTPHHSTIPAVFFTVPQPKFTIIYSHSNAMDLGVMMDFFYKLSQMLQVNMFCYEYSGYGCSDSAPPSESKTFGDITAAFEKLKSIGIDESQIVLYGQSVGSGPSCYLASKYKFRGVILHGGLMSGLNVVSRPGLCRPALCFRCCDIYRNIDRVKAIRCPILLMHGCNDEVIDVSHSKRMHKAARASARYPPYLVPGAGHNDLIECNPQGYMRALRDFLLHLEDSTDHSVTVVNV